MRRGREPSDSFGLRLRRLVTFVPIALKVGSIVVVGVLVFLGYRAAASASFFQVQHVETRGANRASTQAIEAAVRHEVSQTGVWRADLKDLSLRLERLPWVRSAVVTRVLPDGIRVRITERDPKAIVRTSAGRFFWVDDDAVSLGEMRPSDQTPAFFLRGWNEDEAASAQLENRERISKFLELQREWDREGVSDRISEVNVQDLGDVRVQLSGDDSQIEIRLGAENQGKRLKPALDTLDRLRQTPRGPYISYLNVNQPKRIVVGLVSGSQAIADASEATDGTTTVVAPRGEGTDHKKERVKADKEKDKGAGDRNQERKTNQKRG
jgi:cell division protein FtsQ